MLSIVTGGETGIDVDLMEIRALRLVRYQSDELFHHQIDQVTNGSECGLAENIARRDDKGHWEYVNPVTDSEWCKKTDHICRQDDDLGSKLPELHAVAAALDVSPPYKRTAKAAKLALVSEADRKGQACFRHLGDVSIALECDKDETLLTTDASFDVMAPALGIVVERFAATEPP